MDSSTKSEAPRRPSPEVPSRPSMASPYLPALEETHRQGMGSHRRSSPPVWWTATDERDYTAQSLSRNREALTSDEPMADAPEVKSKREENLLEKLMLEGGGIHFHREASQTLTPMGTPSPLAHSEKSSGSSRAAKRRQLEQAATDALRNEERSSINKLSPMARAKSIAQLAGIDDSPDNEMAIRDLVDASDGKRKRKRRVFDA